MSKVDDALTVLEEIGRRVHPNDTETDRLFRGFCVGAADHLRSAPVFQLPANGRVLPVDRIDCSTLTWELPFPSITLSIPYVLEQGEDPQTQNHRHVLVMAARIDCVAPLTRGLPADVVAKCLDSGDRVFAVLVAEERRKSGWIWVPVAIPVLLGTRGPYAHVTKSLLLEYSEAVVNMCRRATSYPVASLLLALSCSNVEIQRVDPPSAVNKKRAKAGKRLLSAHHILMIKAATAGTGKHGPRGGHASPRQHLRRGHIRHLENKNVWINNCVVGDPNRGFVSKDYRVEAHSP